ncbi:MAG: hypothetical protein KY460_05325 [Actinobacteria bacterium]|nr:hypothetical protein [Actinomycetota bacterium]
MTTQLLASDVLPMPVVLAGGAGVVIATAAALTNRSATRPDLPTDRWHRPLPSFVDRPVTRVTLRVGGLVTAVLLIGAVVAAGSDVHPAGVVALLVGVSLLAGPLPRLANPVRIGLALAPPATIGHGTDPDLGESVGWAAVGWLAALSALLRTVEDGRVLGAMFAGYLLLQAVLLRRRGGRRPAHSDALDATSAVVGLVAPLGRTRDGGLAWRNPVVNAAHASPGQAALWLTAVLVALALTGVGGEATTAGVLVRFVAIATVAGAVLRGGIIRAYFRGAVAPLAAAYGLLAGGRWLPPVDLVVFVALHAVAVAVLHRQAIARHDPRTARAVQFLPRLAVLTSVLGGLAAVAIS